MDERMIWLPGEKVRGRGWKKRLLILVLAVLLAGVLTGSVLRGEKSRERDRVQEGLAEEVLRFHVLANSDSEEDQELKLEVKDAVLDYMKRELPKAHSAEETKAWARSHTEEIERTAKRVVRQEGYAYTVSAEVTECEFPDKTYGDVWFPAGTYEALRVEIGEGKGRNWWCVLYPNLCFLDSVHAVVPDEGKEELREVLTDDEYELITNRPHFRIRWFFF